MLSRVAVVIASADCWADDLEAFHGLYHVPHDVIAVNDAGWLYEGRIDHWVTLHPEHMPRWAEKRDPGEASLWTGPDRVRRAPAFDWNELGHWGTGSSSLYAVTVAWFLGYERVVLCGAPMQSEPHAPGASEWNGEPWPEREVQIHREGWTYHRDKIAGMCRSMSGWTRELLGAPESAFLFDRWPSHRRMAENTVRPPLSDGDVTEAYWHCPACGSTRIYALQDMEGSYHCGDCGRDYTVAINPVPWYEREPKDLAVRYPPDLLPLMEG